MDIDINEIRREVFLTLADEPEIELTPAEESCKWDVAVPSIELYFFDSIALNDWLTILLRVKACKGALEGLRPLRQRE